MYEIPRVKPDHYKNAVAHIFHSLPARLVLFAFITLLIISFDRGFLSIKNIRNWPLDIIEKSEQHIPAPTTQKSAEIYTSKIAYEQAIIDTVREASPSVVSIIISKDMPVYKQQLIDPFQDIPGFGGGFRIQIPEYVQQGTEKRDIGSGSGFIVSQDGLIVTNKHVVKDKEADYTVVTNDGEKYSAKVLALDPVKDVAIIKIQDTTDTPETTKKFKPIKLGDATSIQIGQTAIAIGNALGEFSNTVSVGVISGLGRTISASGAGGFSETLESTIQTDAAINLGNSGGPLLNLHGEVIGINTATAQGAQSIGFAVPINVAKRDIEQVLKQNKIVYPFLGVRYLLVNEKVQKEYKLSVDYGALVQKGEDGEPAVTNGSGAHKAGIQNKDLILEINKEKISTKNSLATIIQKYNPGDTVSLTLIRGDKEMTVDVVLGER